jgi:hypothetical protein
MVMPSNPFLLLYASDVSPLTLASASFEASHHWGPRLL